MFDFVPNHFQLRELFIFFFHSKKTTAKAHRELQKVYGDAPLSETTCRVWFRRFKDGDSAPSHFQAIACIGNDSKTRNFGSLLSEAKGRWASFFACEQLL